jgi:hypothetical protein
MEVYFGVNSSSYPLFSAFIDINNEPKLDTNDCACYYVDFSGDYILNWSITDGPQLLSSSNTDVTLGTFDFNVEEEYFNIFLYPKPSINNGSYVHIRYRIPVRYRYSYEDWTFWESLILEGTLSETEFVKVINCCSTTPPSELVIGL